MRSLPLFDYKNSLCISSRMINTCLKGEIHLLIVRIQSQMTETVGVNLHFSIDLIYSYDIYGVDYQYHHSPCCFNMWGRCKPWNYGTFLVFTASVWITL